MSPTADQTRRFWQERRARHPPLKAALVADARITALHRGEPEPGGSPWRPRSASCA